MGVNCIYYKLKACILIKADDLFVFRKYVSNERTFFHLNNPFIPFCFQRITRQQWNSNYSYVVNWNSLA